jgi:FtsP/CotA-like multicopper oxidase with cupredoxin domain
MYGTFIVDPPVDEADPHSALYDDEYVLMVSDWFWSDRQLLFDDYMKLKGKDMSEIMSKPGFESMLANGKWVYPCDDMPTAFKEKHQCVSSNAQMHEIELEYGKRYRLRIVGTMMHHHFGITFDSHSLSVISADGISTKPHTVQSIHMSSGECYDVIIDANHPLGSNITEHDAPLRFGLTAKAHHAPSSAKYPLAYLRYVPPKHNSQTHTQTQTQTQTQKAQDISVELQHGPDDGAYNITEPMLNIFKLENLSLKKLQKPTRTLVLNVTNDGPKYFVNGQSFEGPSTGILALGTNPGNNTIVFDIPYGEVVRIVVNNHDPMLDHPIHFHGHHVQVLGEGGHKELPYDPDVHHLAHRKNPIRKHTVHSQHQTWVVMQLEATSPGYWIAHCHMSFHLVAGFAFILNVQPPVPDADDPTLPDPEILHDDFPISCLSESPENPNPQPSGPSNPASSSDGNDCPLCKVIALIVVISVILGVTLFVLAKWVRLVLPSFVAEWRGYAPINSSAVAATTTGSSQLRHPTADASTFNSDSDEFFDEDHDNYDYDQAGVSLQDLSGANTTMNGGAPSISAGTSSPI